MIPIDFDYYRPDTFEAAVSLFHDLDTAGKRPVYYGGGTEIITMARVHNLKTQAVIDIKGISECKELGLHNDKLIIGAGVTLSRISESKQWALLAIAGGRIADHTTQGKITLGGNVCGTIIYREAILPLLLADCKVLVAGREGTRQVAIREVFDQRPRLKPGELIVQFSVDESYIDLPYVHIKRTKSEKIDYPLLSVSALRAEGKTRIAFSGACAFPFRSSEIERIINDNSVARQERIQQAIKNLPAPLLNDVSGSASFREFVLTTTLNKTFASLEGKTSA